MFIILARPSSLVGSFLYLKGSPETNALAYFHRSVSVVEKVFTTSAPECCENTELEIEGNENFI
jgi:hypothetical protein